MARRIGTVAITGANGFIGRYLMAELADKNVQVRGIERGSDAKPGNHSIGPLERSPNWEPCLSNVETVIHCAAVAHQRLDESGLDALYSINRDAVSRLAEASLRSGVRRLIFLSSAKVYGEVSVPGSPFRECDSTNPEDHYGKSKLQAEERLRPFVEQGLEVCCLRLPLVYGPGVKANFSKLQRMAGTGLPLPLAGIRNARSLLSLENLARTILVLLESEQWPGFHLNVADPAPVSTPELLRALGRAQGNSVRLFTCPKSVLEWLGRCLGQAGAVSKLTRNLELDTSLLESLHPQLQRLSTQDSIDLHFGAGATIQKGAAA